MAIARGVQQYLWEKEVAYGITVHPRTNTLQQAAQEAHIPPGRVARAVFLADTRGPVMAVLPMTHILDFEALQASLARELAILPNTCLAETFGDCDSGSFPPLGFAYQMETVVDASLLDLDRVVFEPGSHTELVSVSQEGFRALTAGARIDSVAYPVSALVSDAQGKRALHDYAWLEGEGIRQLIHRFAPLSSVRDAVEEVENLPAMPEMAHRLLRLKNDPKAGARELARIVELDPSLSAQVVRYATSPLYGYRGRIKSVEDAIARVLGFDMVINLALGIAVTGGFRIPRDGPIGLLAFWRNATYCAALTQELARAMPVAQRPPAGMAYLAGLLSRFGYLLLGHLFPAQFFLLNHVIDANRDLGVRDVEKYVLGVSHEQIGGWLLESWRMPEELVTAVRYQHRADYYGSHAAYAGLNLIANRLLKRRGIGYASHELLPSHVLQALGISETDAMERLARVMEQGEGVENLAHQLAA